MQTDQKKTVRNVDIPMKYTSCQLICIISYQDETLSCVFINNIWFHNSGELLKKQKSKTRATTGGGRAEGGQCPSGS